MGFDFAPRIQQTVNQITQNFSDATVAGPQWDFQGTSGDCDPGKFVTDSPTASGTTMIQISGVNLAGSDSGYVKGVSGMIQFANMEGDTATFAIASIVPDENGCIWIGVANRTGDLTWGGRYVVTFLPGNS